MANPILTSLTGESSWRDCHFGMKVVWHSCVFGMGIGSHLRVSKAFYISEVLKALSFPGTLGSRGGSWPTLGRRYELKTP